MFLHFLCCSSAVCLRALREIRQIRNLRYCILDKGLNLPVSILVNSIKTNSATTGHHYSNCCLYCQQNFRKGFAESLFNLNVEGFKIMIEQIIHDGNILAFIIPVKFSEPGIHFFTPNDLSQQLAYMRHPSGKQIMPHVHNPVPREVVYTQEVLFIRRGRLRVDFYSSEQVYFESRILEAGDVILLVTGGHGFEILDEVEMIEVKQGPYVGDQDKTRFIGIGSEEVQVKE
jgi:mannose-6-phosphate isomerase-like protein (cupin superfamily)